MNDIARIRQFNRTVTQHIGALESNFLGRGRPIGASRILFEIGSRGLEVRQLRSKLGLDSGYTSRLLRTLEKEGLIKVKQSNEDARVRFANLTAKGRNELALLNRLSDEAAKRTLEPLTEQQKTVLVESMELVERLLKASATRIAVQDPTSLATQACLASYYRELAERFENGFNLEKSISATTQELTPPNGYFVVAELYGQGIGCGALKCHKDYGEVKRMWVAPSVRGLGIGKRILASLEALARQQKLRILRLETNKALHEARALYKRSGYREVAAFNNEPYAHYWFEKPLMPGEQ
jgi:DNA-binding MarR family transcriptional regulator/N-acetylglutamate synthase-like GNAT family acetyltransferase